MNSWGYWCFLLWETSRVGDGKKEDIREGEIRLNLVNIGKIMIGIEFGEELDLRFGFVSY